MNKHAILESFAKDTLGYERTGRILLDTLQTILSAMDKSNRTLRSFRINQEDKRLGPPNVIRGLQERLYAARYIHRIIKKRGQFSSVVYLYNPYTFVEESGYYQGNPVSPEEILAIEDRWFDGEAQIHLPLWSTAELEMLY